jgi:mannan endo-1,4-beta-mannosidase
MHSAAVKRLRSTLQKTASLCSRITKIGALAFLLVLLLRMESAPTPVDCAIHIPDNNEFVYLKDSKLFLRDQPFSAVGPNIYWLGLTHEGGEGIRYPTPSEIDNALDTAVAMGSTTVRTFALISVGNPLSIEPKLGEFNDAGFGAIDYALSAAQQRNLRFILPLVNSWNGRYHGSLWDFVHWRGKTHPYEFFNNPQIIQDFKDYIAVVVNHVNPYTGVAYKDDPTILTWQLGNELGHLTLPENPYFFSIADWSVEMAEFIKSLDPDHLVMDAASSNIYQIQMFDPTALNACAINGMSIHSYPLSSAWVVNQATTATEAGKFVLNDEFGPTPNISPLPFYPIDSPEQFLEVLSHDPNIDGLLFWSLWGHNRYGKLYQNSDGYSNNFPYDYTLLYRDAFFRMRDMNPPKMSIERSPLLYAQMKGSEVVLWWQGSVGAFSYTLERSFDNLTWETIATDLDDRNNSYSISTQAEPHAGQYYYRLTPYTPDLLPGASSLAILPTVAPRQDSNIATQ